MVAQGSVEREEERESSRVDSRRVCFLLSLFLSLLLVLPHVGLLSDVCPGKARQQTCTGDEAL